VSAFLVERKTWKEEGAVLDERKGSREAGI
jgi:hypothetical protein